jgi:hypothetical protein
MEENSSWDLSNNHSTGYKSSAKYDGSNEKNYKKRWDTCRYRGLAGEKRKAGITTRKYNKISISKAR